MNPFTLSVISGVVSFVSTNLDDLLILVLLFSSRKIRVLQIVIGQYLGILAIILVSWLSSFINKAIAVHFDLKDFLPYLGILPVLMGLFKLYAHWVKKTPEASFLRVRPVYRNGSQKKEILYVTALTVSAGGDNIAVYTPLFSKNDDQTILLLVLIYLILTAVWCCFALLLLSNKSLGKKIKAYGAAVVPWLWIVLGLSIINH